MPDNQNRLFEEKETTGVKKRRAPKTGRQLGSAGQSAKCKEAFSRQSLPAAEAKPTKQTLASGDDLIEKPQTVEPPHQLAF